MKCPSCGNKLRQLSSLDLVLDICDYCQGVWFDARELGEFIRRLLEENKKLTGLKIKYEGEIVTVDPAEEPIRICPCCNKAMIKYNYAYDSNVILDRCINCNGVWTDNGELYIIATYLKGDPSMPELATNLAREVRKSHGLRRLIDIAKACQLK